MKYLLDRKFTKVLLIIVMILVTILSLMPLSDFKIEAPGGIDKVVHVIMYLGVSTLALFTYSNSTKTTIKIIILVILYSILIEFLQENLPVKRSGDFYDVIANSIGTLLGLKAQLILRKIEKTFI